MALTVENFITDTPTHACTHTHRRYSAPASFDWRGGVVAVAEEVGEAEAEEEMEGD
jgi:hypothetical protein